MIKVSLFALEFTAEILLQVNVVVASLLIFVKRTLTEGQIDVVAHAAYRHLYRSIDISVLLISLINTTIFIGSNFSHFTTTH